MNIQNRHIDIWGDSIMKGVVLDDSDGRYHVLDTSCVNRFSEITKAEIDNHASFGMTTGKAFERIKRALDRRAPEKGDIVLVEFGGNDCDYHWKEISEDPDREHLPNTPIATFGTRLQEIIDSFKKFDVSPILMALPPIEPVRYFNWISRGLDATKILKWLGDVNQIYRWQEAYNDIVLETARANSLRLINVRKQFLVTPSYVSKICSDGIHPNQRGQDTMLDACLSFVQSI